MMTIFDMMSIFDPISVIPFIFQDGVRKLMTSSVTGRSKRLSRCQNNVLQAKLDRFTLDDSRKISITVNITKHNN